MARRLVGVYNADGSLLGELRYLLGRARGTAHCALCDTTHGKFRRRRDFDQARLALDEPLELRHRDELSPEQVAAVQGRLPCVLLVDDRVEILLGPEALEECAGDPSRLVACINEALAATRP
jgi:hypothetical protein